jgi:hypothetical protein
MQRVIPTYVSIHIYQHMGAVLSRHNSMRYSCHNTKKRPLEGGLCAKLDESVAKLMLRPFNNEMRQCFDVLRMLPDMVF